MALPLLSFLYAVGEGLLEVGTIVGSAVLKDHLTKEKDPKAAWKEAMENEKKKKR